MAGNYRFQFNDDFGGDAGESDVPNPFVADDEDEQDRILCEQASKLFDKQEYSSSAQLYARSKKKSFEEIALKFLQLGNEEALKNYLACKLDYLSEKDVTQVTLIVFWLLEIILNEMSSLRNPNSDQPQPDQYDLLLAEFQSLLQERKIKTCIKKNGKAVKDLISSHGNDENMVYFAKEMEDYRAVIEHYILRKQYESALNVLKDDKALDLVYEFAPIIINEAPIQLVDILINFGRKIDPAKLIPALLQDCRCLTKKEYQAEVIRYLEHCMHKLMCEDQVVINYLLALYAQSNQTKLQTYLEVKGDDESMINYDLQYVLRICRELNLKNACVHLYVTMGLFEEAMDIAIEHDIQLAKRVANIPESEELKRKLWLKVAKHVILEEKDINHVTELLKECKLLKIEDVLHYFPDFVVIDHFKDAICSSLQVYNEHINALKGEMEDATTNVEELREEARKLRDRHVAVKSDSTCAVCDFDVISRSFYVFPCEHMYHSDCLLSELQPHLRPDVSERVQKLENSLASMTHAASRPIQNGTSEINSSVVLSSKERIANELDEIVAGECIYCGDLMIRSINKPFITAAESNAMSRWD